MQYIIEHQRNGSKIRSGMVTLFNNKIDVPCVSEVTQIPLVLGFGVALLYLVFLLKSVPVPKTAMWN